MTLAGPWNIRQALPALDRVRRRGATLGEVRRCGRMKVRS